MLLSKQYAAEGKNHFLFLSVSQGHSRYHINVGPTNECGKMNKVYSTVLKSSELWSQTVRVRIPTLPLAMYVIWASYITSLCLSFLFH